ncbi:MAG: hypothetical protein BGO78_10060 [Chloroflexi bacterium 44-23]|nr:MAG: hypothetical protein BGO78_10060 [Chloroflexi bacterium 44-23]
MIEKSGFYMNNRVARYMISSLQDLMGENGLNAVLRHGGLPDYQTILPPDDMLREFDFSDYGAICTALAETYGPRGAKAFLIRAGRAGFLNGIQSFLDNYGASLEATGKLVPLRIKLPLFLRWIAKNYSETSDRIVRIKDQGDHYLYINERCPVCWGRRATQLDCHITLGFLLEATGFISNGARFDIRQISSIGMGDASCDFVVPKRPIPT